MNCRSVSCPDCGKRLTPHFEGGLQGFLTLDLGVGISDIEAWIRSRWLWESMCIEPGASGVCVEYGVLRNVRQS